LNIVRPFQRRRRQSGSPESPGCRHYQVSAFYHKPVNNIRIKIRPSGIPSSHSRIGMVSSFS
jgi:hypothetical protein